MKDVTKILSDYVACVCVCAHTQRKQAWDDGFPDPLQSLQPEDEGF